MRRSFVALVLASSVIALPGSARAAEVLFTGTGAGEGVTLNASALFNITGNTLTITLSNTGDTSGNGADVPSNSLTGLFFKIPNGITLTPVSATIASGDLLQADQCNVGACTSSTTNVGGEFGYAKQSGLTGGANHAISSSGYIPDGSDPEFNGPNLDDPMALDGPNFGIVSPITGSNKFKPNGGLEGVPLIEGQVVFQMTISGGTLLTSQISNVSFQYGTSLSQPNLPGCAYPCGTTPPPPVPEPAAMLLLAPAIAALVRRRKRRALVLQ